MSWRAWAVLLLVLGCGDDTAVTDSGVGADASDVGADPSDSGVPDTSAADTGRADGATPPGAPPIEGYGTESTFGAGGDTCVVSTLDDSGAGSLRECVENRDGPVDAPTPRVITFEVGGTITLVSDLRIRQPHLTVDGLSAPAPGITIEKTGNGEDGETIINTWPGMSTCGHDVLMQGIRFVGVWTRDTTDHSQNAGLLSIDGEDLPGCLHHVVIWRNVYVDGQDSAGTIWGSVDDVTFAYNMVLYNYHPQSISHFPGGEAGQERERLSIHHNVYAWSTERIPNIRGNTWDVNVEQNVMHRWASAGIGSSYAMQLRCRGGGCPQRVNLIENYFTSSTPRPEAALVFSDGADPAEVFSQGNRFPPEETDDGSAPAAFARPAHAEVTLVPDAEVVARVLPFVGLPVRTAEEDTVLSEIVTAMAAER